MLLITPGPAVLYIVARSLAQGRLAGLASAAGILMGNFIQITGAAFGLSAIMLASALAFGLIKLLGALYLVYLGVRRLLDRSADDQLEIAERASLRQIVRQGFLVGVLNPKAALFFFAFLPQFVDTARGSLVSQVYVLGAIFVAMAIVTDSVYAFLAGTLRHQLGRSTGMRRAQRIIGGGVLIALGLTAGLSGTSGS